MNKNKTLKTGTYAYYGYSYSNLPSEIIENRDNIIKIFYKKNNKNIIIDGRIEWSYYNGSSDTPWDTYDYVFADQDAVKILCIGFPTKSKYIYISLKYPKYYIFIIFGLIRRLIHGSIKIKGVKRFTEISAYGFWLILKCKEIETNSYKFSNEIGVVGFINYLNDNRVKYIVPRFFESLPQLNDENKDLDIIIEKKSSETVKSFIKSNPGNLQIDVYTDSGPDYHGITYVPPSKIKEILTRVKEGPVGAKVPQDLDYLHLLMYHVLYHKGYLSKIPSIYSDIASSPDNKYLKIIDRLKRDLQISFPNTLEGMENYLSTVGWKPAIDTLSKISGWNSWVKDNIGSRKKDKFPLYLMILKNPIKYNGVLENKIKKILNQESIVLLEEVILSGQNLDIAIKYTRGGIWNDSLNDNEDETIFYPYKVYILYDTKNEHLNFLNTKIKIREIIDDRKPSLIHTTDTYEESIEYISLILKDKLIFYKNKKLILSRLGLNINERKKFKFNFFLDLIPRIKVFLRNYFKYICEH